MTPATPHLMGHPGTTSSPRGSWPPHPRRTPARLLASIVVALATVLGFVGLDVAALTAVPAQAAEGPAACQASGGVYVYLQPGGGGCSHSGGTGLTVLRSITTVTTNSSGMICQLGGYPATCPDPAPADAYWAYWWWQNGSWVYATLGAGAHHPAAGSVVAWTYGNGARPAVVPPAAAKSTSTTTATSTASSTSTSTVRTATSSTTSRVATSSRTSTSTVPAATSTTATHAPTTTRPGQTAPAGKVPESSAGTDDSPGASVSTTASTTSSTSAATPPGASSASATDSTTATATSPGDATTDASGASVPAATTTQAGESAGSTSSQGPGTPTALLVTLGIVAVLGAGIWAASRRRAR